MTILHTSIESVSSLTGGLSTSLNRTSTGLNISFRLCVAFGFAAVAEALAFALALEAATFFISFSTSLAEGL